MPKDTPPPPPTEVAPKKSKKLVIIVLATTVLLFIIVGVGAVFLLSHGGDEEDEEDAPEEVQKSKKKNSNAPPIFVNLDPFTVNLRPDENGEGFYMQVEISLEVDDLEADALLKSLMPRIRNNLTLILSDKKSSDLVSKEGKQALANEIRDEINGIIGQPAGKDRPPQGPVESVLFTRLIIQ
ncbi:MAG: flagellar basal body-associated FliL family protein [Zoogloeaceae bacterium]|jgi:flagellar FliL protein|nr:flagellar basal body-associated FliL family protein [Zoogloeaceae bacterium]